MITNLCNLVTDFNLDTFYKIRVIETSQLPDFNHLTNKIDVLAILNGIPETVQAMDIPLLPEKTSIKNDTKIRGGNKTYDAKISFPLVPMDDALKALLETYNNRLVIAFVFRKTHAHLYGTSAQPLLFSYDELHSPNTIGLKGFSITMDGESYGDAKYFTKTEQEIMPDIGYLAFTLSGTL